MTLRARWRNSWASDRLRQLAVHIVVLHVPLDWTSTVLALAAAREHGLAAGQAELNPLLASAAESPLRLLAMMSVVGVGIVGLLWVEDHRIATGRSTMTRSGMALLHLAVGLGVAIVMLNLGQAASLGVVADA
jgi:hypothetical protein